ncbi:MAG: hypothetical protein J4400_02735 [Candidatus Aenigmarchaeota archaeon]|nr:hypothetical protein [Candidatus Aenigmarchaeota archaeon]
MESTTRPLDALRGYVNDQCARKRAIHQDGKLYFPATWLTPELRRYVESEPIHARAATLQELRNSGVNIPGNRVHYSLYYEVEESVLFS